MVDKLPYDSCAIYVWEAKTKSFRKLSSYTKRGVPHSMPPEYRQGLGLAGLAKKSNDFIDVYTKRVEDTSSKKVRDEALSGFKSLSAYPLKEGRRWYGVMYLASQKKAVLSDKKKALIKTISRQLTSTIKAEHNLKELNKAFGELKKLKTTLGNAEKMLALGELSATLAHEIKNPIISIGGFANRLKKKLPPDSPHLFYIDYIINEVSTLEELIHTILCYSEDWELELRPEELNSIVGETLHIFTEACSGLDIRLLREERKERIPVMVDPKQLKIAFDNLISNAIQSMEESGPNGTLTVTTRTTQKWAITEISDTGKGIDPKHKANIFDPFFTTKDNGTGLGLTIVNNIIKKHNGQIEVHNNKDAGVTFAVKLPNTEESST